MTNQNEKGVTRSDPPVRKHGGQVQGSDVITYDLKAMDPILVDSLGLSRYLRKHAEDEATEEEHNTQDERE